jgi:hypothetical protein
MTETKAEVFAVASMNNYPRGAKRTLELICLLLRFSVEFNVATFVVQDKHALPIKGKLIIVNCHKSLEDHDRRT